MLRARSSGSPTSPSCCSATPPGWSLCSPDVRQAYYSNLPEGTDRVLATAAWGWHSEVAIHILRMVFAGTFDKHPKLKMVIGHMGEMLPVMLARIDENAGAPPCGVRRPERDHASTDGFNSSPGYRRTVVRGTLLGRSRIPDGSERHHDA